MLNFRSPDSSAGQQIIRGEPKLSSDDTETNPFSDISMRLDSLRPFVEELRQIKVSDFKTGQMFFEAAFSAAFSKIYSCAVAVHHEHEIPSMFLISTLRSCCEELIVLAAINEFENDSDKNAVCEHMLRFEIGDRVELQKEFFDKFRPHQSVLANSQIDLETVRSDAQEIWARNGLNIGGSNIRPDTRRLASMHADDTLDLLYNFLFKIASDNVHFNMRGLLRTGWSDASGTNFIYRPENFDRYCQSVLRIYAPLIFYLHFEFFEARLSEKSDEFRSLASALIDYWRWPEAVTHEEHNFPYPKPKFVQTAIKSIQSEQAKNGFRTYSLEQ